MSLHGCGRASVHAWWDAPPSLPMCTTAAKHRARSYRCHLRLAFLHNSVRLRFHLISQTRLSGRGAIRPQRRSAVHFTQHVDALVETQHAAIGALEQLIKVSLIVFRVMSASECPPSSHLRAGFFRMGVKEEPIRDDMPCTILVRRHNICARAHSDAEQPVHVEARIIVAK
eukprot:IDg21815t1